MIDLNQYIGKPFEIGGRGPAVYDCYGLTKAVAAARSYWLPEQVTPDAVAMRLAMFEKIACPFLAGVVRPRPWAIVAFDYRWRGLHIGTMTAEPGRFIHVGSDTGRVIVSRLADPKYDRFVYGFYRTTHTIRVATKAS